MPGDTIIFNSDGFGQPMDAYTRTGTATGSSPYYQWEVAQTSEQFVERNNSKVQIQPQLYFKYIKKKFTFLERFKIEARIKRLEKAFNKAVENGQDALANNFLQEVSRESRESVLFVKGYKLFIERDDLFRYKTKLDEGHISDTAWEDYTRVIPEDILEKYKKAKPYFDEFWIFHYYNSKQKDLKKLTPKEKAKMKDPVVFGKIKEAPFKYYFIGDWEDEYCDLTFDKIIDHLGKDEKDITLSAVPNFNL